MATSWLKDSSSVLDWAFQWTDWLDIGETITNHTITVPTGLTLDTSSETGGIVTAWLSGGTAGTTYRVACLIETSAGRTDERSISIQVRER